MTAILEVEIGWNRAEVAGRRWRYVNLEKVDLSLEESGREGIIHLSTMFHYDCYHILRPTLSVVCFWANKQPHYRMRGGEYIPPRSKEFYL